MAVSDWSTTAASNTSVGGNNIAEGSPAAAVNNAIRSVMAEAKTKFDAVDAAVDVVEANVATHETRIDTLESTAISGIRGYATWAAASGAFAAYAGGTAYAINDTAVDQSAFWTAIAATTGNAPPTLPTTTNTWWRLVTSTPAGLLVQVPTTDTGTHTDPVVGGTVDNTGVFRYSLSPAGLQRIYDLDSAVAKGYSDTAIAAAAILSLFSVDVSATPEFARIQSISIDPDIVLPARLVLRQIYRDSVSGGRFQFHVAGYDGTTYTNLFGVGASLSPLVPTGYTGSLEITLKAVSGSAFPGIANGGAVGTMRFDFTDGSNFGASGSTYTAAQAEMFVWKLQLTAFDAGQEASIRAFADEQIVISHGTMLTDAATDLFAKQTFGEGIVINGDPLDDYYLNYRFDMVAGAGTAGADLYRAKVWLHSTLRAAIMGYGEKAADDAPPTLPSHMRLALIQNGTRLTGDVGIEALIPVNAPTIAQYVHSDTAYANAAATGIKRSTIQTTLETRHKWTVPAAPKGDNELFIASSGGAGFTSIVDAIDSVTTVVGTIARTTYPCAEAYSPERPLILRIVGAHNEEVTPYTYLSVDQSPLRLPHGCVLMTRPDTLIWMNTAGNSAPVIEMSNTAWLDGGGEVKQISDEGYVVHVDNANLLSGQATETWTRRRIQTRFGNIYLHKVEDNALPIIGAGLSDGEDFIVDGTRFHMDANTTGAAMILIHTAPNAIEPGLIDIRNMISNSSSYPAASHLSLVKAHAMTIRHGLKVGKADILNIAQANTVGGDGTTAGFVRLCPLTGFNVTAISLDP